MTSFDTVSQDLKAGRIDAAIEAIRTNPELLDVENQYGQNLAWLAAMWGRSTFLEAIIHSDNLDSMILKRADKRRRNPLDVAIFYKNSEMQALLEPVFRDVGHSDIEIQETRVVRNLLNNLSSAFLDARHVLSPRTIVVGSMFAFCLALIAIIYTSIIQNTSDPERMIAYSPEPDRLRENIEAYFNNDQNVVQDDSALLRDLAGLGWSDLKIEAHKKSTTEQGRAYLVISCSIVLEGESGVESSTIAVRQDQNREVDILSDVHSLPIMDAELKKRLIESALSICFQ
ncbi:MAG: hypothetical protein AAGA72_05220 [Pseudomonadota bacterium]